MNKIPNIQGKWNTKIELFRMSFLGKQKPNFDKNITNFEFIINLIQQFIDNYLSGVLIKYLKYYKY